MNDLTSNLKTVTFTLDGEQVTADIGQTIWQAAAERRNEYSTSMLQGRQRLPCRRQLSSLYGRNRG